MVLFLAGSRGAFFLAGSYYVLCQVTFREQGHISDIAAGREEEAIAARDPTLRGVLPSASVGTTVNKLCSRSAGEKMNLFLH